MTAPQRLPSTSDLREDAGMTARRTALLLLWATASSATAAAIAAAVVAVRAGLGQQQARITDALVVTACCAVGALILTSRPRQPVGRALLVGGAAYGLGLLPVELLVTHLAADPGDSVARALLLVAFTVRGLGWLVLAVVLPLVFPGGATGRARLWLRAAFLTLGLFVLGILLEPTINDDRVPDTDNPVGLPQHLHLVADWVVVIAFGLGAACLVAGLVFVTLRWRHGTPLVRQQVGWFALGLVATLVGAAVLASGVLGAPVFSVAVAVLPVAIGVAVLQHRLYEVDVLVNRALLYALLTSAVVAVYVLVVGGVGAVLGARGAGWLPLVATAVVAVGFQPLREALQRGVNRLTYGAWHEPHALVRGLHSRLEQAASPDRALADVLAAVRDDLRLESLAVQTPDGEVLAEAGSSPGADRTLPLVHAGTPVGTLVVGGGSGRRRDEEVLTELAGALAPAVQATRLRIDLARSRERLVLAREEERRRLRRDLHDGLGPALAGLTLKLDTARNRLGDDALLREMRSDVQSTIVDVRRLVDGLRPVSLDELGLVGSLQRLVDRAPPDGPDVRLVADDADSPAAAVEVAAYRIVQEALTNVLRHAGARECEVSVQGLNGSLVVSVADDGTGTFRPGDGSGLETMRERAEELGGTLELLPRPGGGTVVRAVLPRNPS
jgi:signal transduction histidine kinase